MFTEFRRDKRGGFAIAVSLFLSAFILVGFAGFDVYYASIQKVNFQELVKAACYRSLNPTRTNVYEDEDRQEFAEKVIDATFASSRYDNVSRTVESSWLNTNVNATASISAPIGVMGFDRFELMADYECTGIPPYPHDEEILLSSNFETSQGEALTFTEPHNNTDNCWDKFTHEQIGWDGMIAEKANDGKPGIVEIQDWTRGNKCWPHVYPPEAFGSNYAIELDSDYNTSIWKELELHPGQYRFELWYFGRSKFTTTNGIQVSIEGARDENPIAKQAMINVAISAAEGWNHYEREFTVDQYEMYKVYLEAKGTSDSVGGIINGFKLIYVDELSPDS